MVKNQRNSCCHMGCPPMFVNLHFHRVYFLGPQKSKPLIIYGIVSEKDAPALYGQASRREAQACDEQECRHTLKSWDDFIHRQQCHGPIWQPSTLYMELV